MRDFDTRHDHSRAAPADLPPADEMYRKLSSVSSDFTHACVRRGLERFSIAWIGGAVEKVTGYTGPEIMALGCWLPIVHPEDQARMGAHLLALAAGDSGEVAFRFVRKCGAVRWVLERYACEQGASAYTLCLYGSISDITESRAADEALRASEERLRVIADNTYDWEYWRAPDGRYIWVSPSCARITGYPPAAFTSDAAISILSLVHPEDRHLWDSHVREVDNHHAEHRELDFRIVKRTGETVWLSHICKPIFNQQGGYLGRRGCNRDITERKNTEQALAHSEQRLRRAELVASTGNWEIDLAEGAFHSSQGARTIYGLTREDVGLAEVKAMALPEHRTTLDKMLAQLVEQGQPYSTDFKIRRPLDGVVLEVHVSAVYDKTRHMVFGIVQDITERKRAEEFIAASLREKDILLREIHHRVKNNLQIILSLLSLQEQGVDNPVALAALAESRGRVLSMALIHEQLYRSQDLSRIDVESYLQDFVPRLAATYKGARDIALRLDLQRVCLNIDQAIPFGLIVNELVTNALKHAFGDSAQGALCVAASQADGQVRLRVEDNGVGLPKGFRLEGSSSLGLQIVALLTGQLGGMMCLDGAAGASFTLQFPLRQG